MPLGALRVYEADSRAAYGEADPEFAEVIKRIGTYARSMPVTIAVVDTGIYADRRGGRYHQADEEYLTPRLAGSDANPPGWYRLDVSGLKADGGNQVPPVTSDSMWHGTAVAGQAAWGTDLIKLIDCRVKYDHTINLPSNAADMEARYLQAFAFASARGARVVNISQSGITSTDDESPFRKAMLARPDLLFVGNAGNTRFRVSRGVFTRRAADDIPNLLLVGGCTMDGQVEKNEDGQTFGWGWDPDLVDIAVPGDYQDLYTVPELPRAFGSETFRDMGISFGCPVAANVAAKMMLLCPSITPEQVRKIIMSCARTMPSLAGKNRKNGMLSAISCYEAAHRKWVPIAA